MREPRATQVHSKTARRPAACHDREGKGETSGAWFARYLVLRLPPALLSSPRGKPESDRENSFGFASSRVLDCLT